jgi:hypothetical protein
MGVEKFSAASVRLKVTVPLSVISWEGLETANLKSPVALPLPICRVGAATSLGAGTNLVPLGTQATWVELAGGVTFKHTDRLSYYAQFGYQFALTNNTSISGLMGDIGLRYTW